MLPGESKRSWTLEKTEFLVNEILERINEQKNSVDNSVSKVIQVTKPKTRTGNPIEIDDALAGPAEKTVIKLVPKQDLHGYDSPWPTGGGKQLIPYPYKSTLPVIKNGITFTEIGNGRIHMQGTATNTVYFDLFGGSSSSIPSWVKPNTTYTLRPITVSSKYFCQFILYGSPSYTATGSTFTTPNDLSEYTGFALVIGVYNGAEVNADIFPMLEYGSTVSDWQPYENICPISGYDMVDVNGYGDNLFDTAEEQMYEINQSGAVGSNSEFRHTSLIRVRGSKCRISFDKTDTASRNLRLHGYDSNGNWLRQINLTVVADKKSYEYEVDIPSDIAYIVYSYMEYIANISIRDIRVYPIAVSLATNGNQTAGTVYSGELTLLADGSGQVEVDSAILTEQDFISVYSDVSTGGLHFVQLDNRGNPAAVAGKCNMMGVDTTGAAWNSTIPVVQMAMEGRIRVYGAFTTISEFKTQFAGLQIVYPLITPLTFTLTDNQVQMLLGYNYIYTDETELSLTYRQESLATNETLLKPLPTGTATGNPVTFSDGADGVPLKKLVLNVEPVQDLHGYDGPWPAGGGKNKFSCFEESRTVNGVDVQLLGHSISLSGTATANYNINTNFGATSGGAKLKPGTTYCWSVKAEGTYGNIQFYGGHWGDGAAKQTAPFTVGGSATITVTSDEGNYYDRFWIGLYEGETYNCVIYPQLEEGNSATAWSPYSNICPITGWDGANMMRTGKNLLDPAKRTSDNNGYRQRWYYNDGFLLKANQAYTFSVTYSNPIALYIVDKVSGETIKNGNSPLTVTVAQDTLVYIQAYRAQDISTIDTFQLEPGSTASGYESFASSTTLPISFPSEAGTVYGGTIMLDENGEGTLVVDAELEVFNDVQNNGISSQLNYLAQNGTATVIGDMLRVDFQVNTSVDQTRYNRLSSSYTFQMCNMLPHVFSYANETPHWYRNTVLYVYFPTALVGETVTSFIDYLVSIKDTNPLSFWIPLATPLTYPITANQVKTLLGANVILSNAATNIEVEYHKNVPNKDDTNYKYNASFNDLIVSGGSMTIGNTTITEAQLQSLLSLVGV